MQAVRQIREDEKETSTRQYIFGEADLVFKATGERTDIERLYYTVPVKILFPRGDVKTAALVTTGGGLFGGDRYDLRFHAKENSHVLVGAQAAEKVYRSAQGPCFYDLHMTIDEGAAIEYLPQETILFNESQFHRHTVIDLKGDAAVLAGEITVFGRLAHGETFDQGDFKDEWTIRCDGKLLWRDMFRMRHDIPYRKAHKAGLNGANAMATSIYRGPEAKALCAHIQLLQGEAQKSWHADNNDAVFFGASMLGELLVVRYLARKPHRLRTIFAGHWISLRNIGLGREAIIPRLWTI